MFSLKKYKKAEKASFCLQTKKNDKQPPELPFERGSEERAANKQKPPPSGETSLGMLKTETNAETSTSFASFANDELRILF